MGATCISAKQYSQRVSGDHSLPSSIAVLRRTNTINTILFMFLRGIILLLPS